MENETNAIFLAFQNRFIVHAQAYTPSDETVARVSLAVSQCSVLSDH